MSRAWTQEEAEYLEENWGNKGIPALAKILDRSFYAVRRRAWKMNLGDSRSAGDGINIRQFALAVGIDQKTIKKQWVDKCGLKVRKLKTGNRSMQKIYLEEFWPWAGKNKIAINFANWEPGALGKEPAWVAEKRKADQTDPSRRTRNRKWDKEQDTMLVIHTKSCKYTYRELADMFNRTESAIRMRLVHLEVPYRPVPLDSHLKWTEEENTKMLELHEKGYSTMAIAKTLGKSQSPICDRIKVQQAQRV